MSDALPEGWVATKLDHLNDSASPIGYGVLKPGPQTEDGIVMLRVKDVFGGRVHLEEVYKITPALDREFARSRLAPGDVVVTVQGSVGRVAVIPKELVGANISRTIARIRPKLPDVTPWIWAYLQAPQAQERMGAVIGGTTRDSLNIRDLRALDVPVPPLPEQRRIVTHVEALLEQVNRAKERLDRVPIILKRFRQAVLAAACSDGEEVDLGDLLNGIRYGTAVKCTPTAKGTPVLRIPNVVSGVVDHTDMKYGPLTAREQASLNLIPGDLLMIRSNGSVGLVGRAALVTELETGCSYAGYLMRLRPNRARILPEYLHLALQTYNVRLQVELPARSTSGVHNINSEEVGALRICVPSLDEQQAAVKEVGRLFALADTIERRVQAATARADKLPQAILSKAFAGELVPTEAELARAEGRTYETAEDLLKRVSASAPTAGSGTKARRRTTKNPK